VPIHNPIVMTRQVEALRHSLGPVISQGLADKMVVEVMVNPDGKIWLDRIGQGRSYTGQVMKPSQVETVLRLLAHHAGEIVSRDRPLVEATLPETGERFQGTHPPISAAPAFSIRKRPEVIFTLEDYLGQGAITLAQAEMLRRAVAERQNILIVGGTSSGKTTFANALLAEPLFKKDRVVILEDTAELQCSAEDQYCMLTKRSDPPVTMRDLVRTTLRLRPDRVIVGEVRDGAALDLLKVWNTGHPGGVATLHANSAVDALGRIEDLVGEVTERVPHRAIASAINFLVFMVRQPTGWRVEGISAVHGHENGRYQTQTIS
jgi:type IV secretion system protein TrbB